MKQTRLFLATCALLVCTCAFAQEQTAENKPTKEETIKWLEEKLNHDRMVKFVFTECEMIVKAYYKDDGSLLLEETYPLAAFIGYQVQEDDMNNFLSGFLCFSEGKYTRYSSDGEIQVLPKYKYRIYRKVTSEES